MTANLGFLPATLVAGETIWISSANTDQDKTDITISGFTPPDYKLTYEFAASTPLSVEAEANGDNSGWTLTVTSAQTLTFGAGLLRYVGYLTNTTNDTKWAVDAGVISVAPSPLATSAWQDVVTACDAAILNNAGSGVLSLSVEGFSVTYKTTEELRRLRAYAQSMADRELGRHTPRIIRARFT